MNKLVEHNHDQPSSMGEKDTVIAHTRNGLQSSTNTTVLAKAFLGIKLSAGSAIFSEHVSSLREHLGIRL